MRRNFQPLPLCLTRQCLSRTQRLLTLRVQTVAACYSKRKRRDTQILHPEVARQEELRKRFEQEAYAVNKLEHAGVVQIRDIGTTDDGCPFLVNSTSGFPTA